VTFPGAVYHAVQCISALVEDCRENAVECGRQDVCALLCTVLARYMERDEIAEACCRAIYELRPLNAWLGRAGACALVLETFALHPNSGAVAQWVCRAIGSLAELRENKIELDKHNVCRAVTNALQKHVSGDGVFSSVFSFQSSHSAAIAQWGEPHIYIERVRD
jgi:hypothetical protein